MNSMKKIYERISLEVIEFGDEPEDRFYCLVDLKISPDGLNIEKLKLSDPRNFDQRLKESGCLMMFTGDEIGSLTARGDLDSDNLHHSLIDLSLKEGHFKNPGEQD